MAAKPTSLSHALLIGTISLALAGCAGASTANTSPTSVTSPSPIAEPQPTESATVEAEPKLVTPDAVDVTATPVEINENLYEWFPAGTDQQIKATLSELYATTTSYTELQKGSRPQKADDWKLIETKVKPLFNEGAWDDLAANFEEGIWTVVVPGGNAPDGSGFSISSGIEGRDEDEKFTFDDDGYTWIHATESPMTFETMINEETGTPVVLVDNIRFRLLAGTTNNETVWLDMKISYTFEQAADGSWDVGRWEHIIEKQGVATTQEELDALPAV